MLKVYAHTNLLQIQFFLKTDLFKKTKENSFCFKWNLKI